MQYQNYVQNTSSIIENYWTDKCMCFAAQYMQVAYAMS